MRYHLNFSNETLDLPDVEGAEFASLEDAVAEGRAAAREILSLDRGEPDPRYVGGRFSVTDGLGQLVATIVFDEAQL